MSSLALVFSWLRLLAAQDAAQPTTPPPPAAPRTLDARVRELERELERLRLQGDDAATAPPAAPETAASPTLLNPTVTGFANALFRYDDGDVFEGEERIDDRFNVREVELDFRAAVDPFADGVIIVAFESEQPGELEVGIEEAYVNIKRLPLPIFDDPPLGLKLRVGRFRTEMGRVNRLHLHDLPQMTRPLTVEEFLGEEGLIGNGLSAQVFLPFPFDEDSAFELTTQLLTGGGAPLADGPANRPAFIANLRWFRTVADAHNLDLSLIFHYGRTDPAGERSSLTYSADFLYKWKPLRRGEYRSFVLGGQLFHSRRDFVEPIDTDGDGVPDQLRDLDAAPFGYFAFAQLQLSRSAYLGVRWDDTATLTIDSLRRRAIGGYLTLYASEFLRFRLGYEHRISDLPDEDGRNSAFAELNFVIGAHPPEPFWVNR